MPARIIGKLHAELAYHGPELFQGGDPVAFLDHVLGELGRTHEALSADYFGT